MEGFGGSGFNTMSSVMKRKRSTTTRKPRPDSQFVVEGRDSSSHSSTPSSDNVEGMDTSRRIRKEDRKYGDLSEFYGNNSARGVQSGNGMDMKRCSEGVLAPANWKSSSKAKEGLEMNSGHSGGVSSGAAENKLKKVRLKVGGVTRTFHAKSNLENENGGSSARTQTSDGLRHRQKLILQDNSDDDHTPAERGEGSKGIPSRDFSEGLPQGAIEDSRGKLLGSGSKKRIPLEGPVRKSKRVPKKRVLDGTLKEGDEDDEILCLEKLRTQKLSTDSNSDFEDDREDTLKKKNISKVSKSKKTGYYVDEKYGSSRSSKESKLKSRAEMEFDDMDFIEEEETGSDNGVDPKSTKLKKEALDTLGDIRVEPLTKRQRALQSGKGTSTGKSLVEFPDGLPPAPPRKQKQKLSEVEQQAKKAEAAQRRRMQVEKAARESEAEAIRKILGQDSNRKKKEEKMRKERDEMAQKRAAESLVLASNSIRWIMGPTGTVVTFGEDVGLPSIFEPKTTCYPPPRQKCAAPSCKNAYKYRDSKLNLPLCSLHCYKVVQESFQTISTC